MRWSTAYLDEAEMCDTEYLPSEGDVLFSRDPAELTGQVADRVVRLSGFAEQRRRQLLTRMLDRPEVIDGTIQGRSVRLLLREGASMTSNGASNGASNREADEPALTIEPPFHASRTASSSGLAAAPPAPAAWPNATAPLPPRPANTRTRHAG